MRALKVAYAWVNNVDSKDHNSMLVWDGQKTVGYLIDFGTSLGADAGLGASKEPCEGTTYAVDLKEWSLEFVTLGMHKPMCDMESPEGTSIGRFSKHVDPNEWKPYAPNIAFGQMSRQDARWMARRLALFSRDQIVAAVSAGAYSKREDSELLVERLIQRRDGIVKQYLGEEDEQDDP